MFDSLEKLSSACLKTLLELINASACINELLLAGKERMALGADVNADLAALGRTGNEGFAASTLNGYFFVSRMESFLHDNELYALNENDSRDFARLTFFGGVRPPFAEIVFKS